MMLSAVLHDIYSIVFPPLCLGCSEILHPFHGQIFCADCHDKVHLINGSICSVCGIAFPVSPAEDHLCGDCLNKRPYFSLARAVFSYEDIILNAIHQFKYKRNLPVGESLASFMAGFSFPDIDKEDYSMIIPVPLHIKRLRERGFNQSLMLANALGKKYNLPVNFSALKRHSFTLSQAGSSKKERQQNIRGVFEIYDRKAIAHKNILLVDDVYTTGATVNECSKTLIQAGAQKIAVLTLARVL